MYPGAVIIHGQSIAKCIRQKENERLLLHIQQAYVRGRGTYGSPRITAELRDNGIQCGKNRIARLMKENGIKAKTKRRFKATTKSRHDLLVAENLLKQRVFDRSCQQGLVL